MTMQEESSFRIRPLVLYLTWQVKKTEICPQLSGEISQSAAFSKRAG